MDKTRFKAIRKALGWSLAETRDYLGLKSERTIRRFERGDTPISGPVAKLMEQAMKEKK
jgi:transcriptional regulator with XRE-family HTH domain